jgi:hypothetical protein
MLCLDRPPYGSSSHASRIWRSRRLVSGPSRCSGVTRSTAAIAKTFSAEGCGVLSQFCNCQM